MSLPKEERGTTGKRSACEDTDTKREKGRKQPCDDGDRDYNVAFMPKNERIASKHQKLEARKKKSLLQFRGFRGSMTNTLISDSYLPELWENKFLLF